MDQTMIDAGIALGTFLLVVGTMWLAVEARRHTKEMREANSLASRQMAQRVKPCVVIWLEPDDDVLRRGDVLMMWARIENVGEGPARNVRWWFEYNGPYDSPKLGSGPQPTSEESAGGVDSLPAGKRVQFAMGGGEQMKTMHQGMVAYLKYEDMEGSEYKERFRLDTERLYTWGGGPVTNPLMRIANAIGKKGH